MRKQSNRNGRYYRYAAVALLIIFLISAAFLALELWERNQGQYHGQGPEATYLEYQGKQYALRDNVEAFLVLGLDKLDGTSIGDSYNNDKQADFLLLFVFDHEAKKCTTIHINRDTMTDVNVLGVAGNKIDTVTKQIALAHTYGNGRDVSCRNTADAVSALFKGAKINSYLSATMDAVVQVNDSAGGVEVTVLEDFTGIDDTLVKGEKVTLMGQQTLTYIRTRSGLADSSNLARMERQRQYMSALREKVGLCMEQDENFLLETTLKVSDFIISDRSVNQLQELANNYYAYESGDIIDLKGESKQGEQFMEFYPDEDSLMKLVIELFYEEV